MWESKERSREAADLLSNRCELSAFTPSTPIACDECNRSNFIPSDNIAFWHYSQIVNLLTILFLYFSFYRWLHGNWWKCKFDFRNRIGGTIVNSNPRRGIKYFNGLEREEWDPDTEIQRSIRQKGKK